MSNTERLYYQDPYLREFTAHVIACRELDGKPAVALDRTAFYPTAGGQPNDTGTLNGVPVVDVVAEDGLIWHVLESSKADCQFAPQDEVSGALDWPRRFDHMQQHTGQHVLSQAFIETHRAETVAFHLGASYCTIDLNRVDLSPGALAEVEAAANAVVDAALPVTATFFAEADLTSVPLRRPPKVSGQIRVVEVAGFDWSACGGTHVRNTAEVGLIKVVGAERRGPETRITFLCGKRARGDYTRLQALAEGLAGKFTVGQHELSEAVDRLLAEHKVVRKELSELEDQWAAATAAALWVDAQPPPHGDLRRGKYRVVAQVLDCSLERAKRVAQVLRANSGAVIFLGVRGERPQLIFTRGDDVALDAGALLRTAAAAGGGRGGGRPDWAQGGVPTNEGLEKALTAAIATLGG
jgi:alanyl-tRNA synthetase